MAPFCSLLLVFFDFSGRERKGRGEMKGADRVKGHSEMDLFLKFRMKFKP